MVWITTMWLRGCAVITGNVDYDKDGKPLYELINMIVENVSVITVTLIYAQTQFKATVLINESFFESNIGPYTGDVLALHYKSSLSQTVINNTHFIFASNDYHDQKYGAILFLVVLKVSFL